MAMMTRWVTVRWFAPVCASAASLMLAAPAEAQDEGWGDEDAASEDGEKKTPPESGSEPAATAEASAEAEASTTGGELSPPADDAPAEEEPEQESMSKGGKALGLRYRGIYIPQTALNWFMEGGQSVYVNGFGPEFSIRDKNKEYILSAWLSFYNMSPTPIKGSSDDELAWEIVESNMKAVYLTADYLWHTRLARTLELSYGGGAGLGFLFGDLYRTQATLVPGGTAGNADDYIPCSGQSATDPYCDDINDHYSGYTEPSWFGGGSKPVLFPWITGQIGLRYQPHDKIITRLDLGIGTSGLYFGVGADYSL